MKGYVWCGIGLLTGGIAGFFIGRKVGYQNALDDAEDLLDDVGEEMKRGFSEDLKEKVVREKTSEPEEVTNKTERVNYQARYEEAKKEEEEKDETELSEEEEWSIEHEKEKNDKIRIISFEDAEELPGYYQRLPLFYWMEDEVVTTGAEAEETEVIEPSELETLIGDALDRYGFRENEEQLIFVRNPQLGICYEVEKIRAAWADAIENV